MNRILVGNDDGIESFGLRTLVRFLSHMAEVYVVAPDSQCSGHGQAITLSGLVTAREIELEGAERAIALTGTPADCAKFGIDMLRAEGIEPDYSGPWDMILGYMAFNLQGMPIGVIKGQIAHAAKSGGFHSVENRSVLLSTGMHDINILRNE